VPSRKKKPPLVEQRLELQKIIADGFREQNLVYAKYVQPNVATARLLSSAPRGSDIGVVKVLSLERADMLDRDTPTGALEYGRAYVEHWSGVIRRTRTQLRKVEDELERTRAESARIRAQNGQRNKARISGLFAERLGTFQQLVQDAREGSRTHEEMA
jgi:hypothetical protein